MTVRRVSKRVDGKVVKGYLVGGEFYRTKQAAGLARTGRKEHYTTPNPLCGLIGSALMHDTQLLEDIQDAFANFAGSPYRTGRYSISIQRLIELADTQEHIYSAYHPDSPNSPVYDAAMTVLVQLLREYVEDWKEEYGYDDACISQVHGDGILGLMQSLGYDVSNSTGKVSNCVNVTVIGGKVLTGKEANVEWLRQQGLSPLRS